ncbi:hypothetical protein LIA77_01673 [Sarocladium implicatum]|nr:hypothetical protein LIA77_01673 [Sarocladium implicatum]
MKLTLAFTALFVVASTSILPETDTRGVQSLPEIDVTYIPDALYGVAAADSEVLEGRDLSARQSCPAGYPFICNKRCCKYNICCKKQCCLPSTDFCGADGLCYRWT